jgi:MoxR-like ATPase
MKPSDLKNKLSDHIQENRPVMIYGQPGIGKSNITQQIADSLGYELLDVRAVLLDPTDIKGIPYVVDGELRNSQPSIFPKQNSTNKPWLLFLDEIVLAPPSVQSALFQLVLDFQIGDYKLPDNTRIIAAGNRQEDRSGANRMLSALSNRFIHYDLSVDLDDWLNWAMTSGIHEDVISFIRFRPNLLSDFDPNKRSFPSPRAWEFVSDTIPNLRIETEYDTLSGTVGEGAAGEFLAFLKTARNLPDVDKLIQDHSNWKIPTDPATLYALSGAVSARAKPDIWTKAISLINRLPKEFQVVTVKDSIVKDAELQTSTSYLDWVSRNTDVLFPQY